MVDKLEALIEPIDLSEQINYSGLGSENGSYLFDCDKPCFNGPCDYPPCDSGA